MGGKKRVKQFCQQHPNSASNKFGKKSSEESTKTRFLYSHEYRDKKGGEKRAKQFCQQHPYTASNKGWKKIVRK